MIETAIHELESMLQTTSRNDSRYDQISNVIGMLNEESRHRVIVRDFVWDVRN